MQRQVGIANGVAGVLLLAALALDGCGGSAGSAAQPTPADSSTAGSSFMSATAVQQARTADAPVSPAIVTADDTFGLDLVNLLNQGGSTNLAISPISIALALQMLYNGAAGTTQQAMAQALQLQSLAAPQVDSDNAALQAALIDPDPEVQLTIANSLWMHLDENAVNPGFTQINETYYGAQIGDLAGAPADINAWVANATDGLITQILPTNFNPAKTVLVIANALYFKGAWHTAFDPAQTTPAPFTRADGTQVPCSMMHQSGITYGYLQTGPVEMIRLPYGQKNRISMIIVLPQAGVALDSVLASLTTAQLNSWIAELVPAQVTLALPRFTTAYSNSLVGPLTALGMGIAFEPTVADLSGIAAGTFVSFVQHATAIQVDETGTVAAGSTSVGVGVTIALPSVTLTVDRPFLYAIRDDENGTLLFIGLMFDPTST